MRNAHLSTQVKHRSRGATIPLEALFFGFRRRRLIPVLRIATLRSKSTIRVRGGREPGSVIEVVIWCWFQSSSSDDFVVPLGSLVPPVVREVFRDASVEGGCPLLRLLMNRGSAVAGNQPSQSGPCLVVTADQPPNGCVVDAVAQILGVLRTKRTVTPHEANRAVPLRTVS